MRDSAKGTFGLALQLAKAEFKTKNEGSHLGILWYLLNPMLTFGILYLVFADRLGTGIAYYPAYLLLGIIMFNFFQSTTIESAKSILREYHYLLKSINFPRESLVLSIVIKNIFSHLFEIALLGIIFAYFGIGLTGLFWYLPILALLSAFAYGSSLIISSLTVYFVDLDNIWNFASKIIWFGTPIFYAIEYQTRLYQLNLLNPMYYLITLAREALLYHRMPTPIIAWGSVGFSIAICAIGMILFGRLKGKFAELV